MTRQRTTSRWVTSHAKRGLDLVLVLAALPIVVPLIIVASAISMVWFRAWPLFLQARVGRNGDHFRVLKIRSLPLDFPTAIGKHDLDHDGLDRVSTFLRASHLDELPQVFNVLGGTMSLVGPRPMIDEVIELLNEDCQRDRHLVRPGLTGLWQISTAGARSLHECPELDLAYVEDASFGLDVTVLWWTVRVAVGRGPALEPEELLARVGS